VYVDSILGTNVMAAGFYHHYDLASDRLLSCSSRLPPLLRNGWATSRFWRLSCASGGCCMRISGEEPQEAVPLCDDSSQIDLCSTLLHVRTPYVMYI